MHPRSRWIISHLLNLSIVCMFIMYVKCFFLLRGIGKLISGHVLFFPINLTKLQTHSSLASLKVLPIHTTMYFKQKLYRKHEQQQLKEIISPYFLNILFKLLANFLNVLLHMFFFIYLFYFLSISLSLSLSLCKTTCFIFSFFFPRGTTRDPSMKYN